MEIACALRLQYVVGSQHFLFVYNNSFMYQVIIIIKVFLEDEIATRNDGRRIL